MKEVLEVIAIGKEYVNCLATMQCVVLLLLRLALEEIATTLPISQFKLFICNSVNIYNNTCCYSQSCLYEVAVFD